MQPEYFLHFKEGPLSDEGMRGYRMFIVRLSDGETVVDITTTCRADEPITLSDVMEMRQTAYHLFDPEIGR